MIDIAHVLLDILRASATPSLKNLIETRVPWDEGDLFMVLLRKMEAAGNHDIKPSHVRTALERLERAKKVICDEQGEWHYVFPVEKKAPTLFDEEAA